MRYLGSAILLGCTPLAAACGSTTTPCLGVGSCPSGMECLASRCVAEGSAPVTAEAGRALLRPIAVAVAMKDPADGVGPTITLGNASRSTALYVQFPRVDGGRIEAAFLLLEQSPGVNAGPDVELEVWRASEAWTGSAFAWSNQPGFSPPSALGIARSAPQLPVRVDVTPLVEFISEHPHRDYGFAIRAREARGPGVTLDTGVAGGTPPRLDIYFEPRSAAPPGK